ncbi:MAG: lamin tail domain-containing protein [Candidatus Promineifilaceae bacterium]
MNYRVTAITISALAALALPLSTRGRAEGPSTLAPGENNSVLIDAVYYDTYEYFDAGEAVALRNTGDSLVDISGWRLTDGSSSSAVLPPGTMLAGHGEVWITNDAAAFRRQFGTEPQEVVETWPGYANNGDEVLLFDTQGTLVDTLVYEGGDTTTTGWLGEAIYPYSLRGVFSQEGQVLYRRLDQQSGMPVPDTNRSADWAQARSDAVLGRRVRYPGWEGEKFFYPAMEQNSGGLSLAVAPDNAYAAVKAAIDDARHSIALASLTIENLALGDALTAAAVRGVDVDLLLEGGPVGGINDHERAICRDLEQAGGRCWFMISAADEDVYDRYQYMHGKYLIIDSTVAVVSSENFSPASMPYDDKEDGTWGRRGIVLMTDAPAVVRRLEDVFDDDLDPAHHQDILRWQSDHPTYGLPQAGYVPIQASGGVTYTVRFPHPVSFKDAGYFTLHQAPENMLRNVDGILGVIGRAGEGDTVLAQQLQERPHWGAANSDPSMDPNVRLEAMLAAARRGARVRFLLDSYYDVTSSPVSNAATCARLEAIAQVEQLQLECISTNPTGMGIHNKMILVQVDGQGYVQIGSWNGTELSSKGNREIALLVQSNAAYAYLADLFERDWPHLAYLPVMAQRFRGPSDYLLISEILYDSPGADDAEFIEIANPTSLRVSLSGLSIGDAVSPGDYEDVRRFPENAVLEAYGVVVVATTATAFFEQYGLWPDYEVIDTEPLVEDLIDDPDWGDRDTFLRLGNQGDEVILRDATDAVIDVVTYGSGSFGEQTPCELVQASNHSLERMPYWYDTDDCPADFREWPFPSPGKLP